MKRRHCDRIYLEKEEPKKKRCTRYQERTNTNHADYMLAMSLQEEECYSYRVEIREELVNRMIGNSWGVHQGGYESNMYLSEMVGSVKRGLSQQGIDSIPTHIHTPHTPPTKYADDCCAICLHEWTDGHELKTLPCSHTFHNSCINRWLLEKKTCPICIEEIVL